MQTLKENPFNFDITEDCLYLNVYSPQVSRLVYFFKYFEI